MTVSWGTGGLSIGALLNPRGVVRIDSPVFALFGYSVLQQHRDNIGEYMDYACTRMLQLFHGVGGHGPAGSPYDVNKYGRTILHVSPITLVLMSETENDVKSFSKTFGLVPTSKAIKS